MNKQSAAGENFQELQWFWQFLSTFPAIWHSKINRKIPAIFGIWQGPGPGLSLNNHN